MRRSPHAGRSQIDLARLGLGIGNELGNRFGRNRWIYHHNERKADDARDRRDVVDEIVIELLIKRRVDRVRRTCQEERVAVRGSAHDRFGADIAAATWAVFDDELLAKPLREPRRDEPRENVWRAGGARGGDDAHRPRRVGLRPRDARDYRQRGSAYGQIPAAWQRLRPDTENFGETQSVRRSETPLRANRVLTHCSKET